VDDSALVVSAGSPPNIFHPTFFIQKFGWWANRMGPKKSWLVPSSICYLIPKSLVQSGQTGPVRSDRSSQIGQKSQAIFEIWELSM
jgi:hypothetical protein